MVYSRKYLVLLLDVVGSSGLVARDALTALLTATIEQANGQFHADCWAPFEITQGDEVAAVLTSASRVYEMVDLFRDALAPVEVRAVLVLDRLSAGLETRRSTIIDGPAFYRADQVMEELKKTQKRFALAGAGDLLDEATAALMNFLLWRWQDLTELQRKIVRLYQQEKNQTRVADLLGRKQQQVQSSLDACRWEIIDGAEAAVRKLFRAVGKDLQGALKGG